METTEEIVKQNVRRLREERRHTVRSLSARLGELGRPILPSGITKIEDGSRRVDVGDLVALARALDVSPATLLMPAEPEIENDEHAWKAWEARWRWAHGEGPLPGSRVDPARFRRANRPYEHPNAQTETVRAAARVAARDGLRLVSVATDDGAWRLERIEREAGDDGR